MAKALALTITLSPETRALPLAGELVPLNGTVEVRKAGETESHPVTGRTQVGPGDSIRTGLGGNAQVLFPDGSGLLLESNIQMTIKETSMKTPSGAELLTSWKVPCPVLLGESAMAVVREREHRSARAVTAARNLASFFDSRTPITPSKGPLLSGRAREIVSFPL